MCVKIKQKKQEETPVKLSSMDSATRVLYDEQASVTKSVKL